MSGGSYDYLYSRVEQMADDMERRDAEAAADPVGGSALATGCVYDRATKKRLSAEESVPILARVNAERAWFAGLLRLVATAMHDVEWVDSCDCSPGDEVKAIDAVRAYVGEKP